MAVVRDRPLPAGIERTPQVGDFWSETRACLETPARDGAHGTAEQSLFAPPLTHSWLDRFQLRNPRLLVDPNAERPSRSSTVSPAGTGRSR